MKHRLFAFCLTTAGLALMLGIWLSLAEAATPQMQSHDMAAVSGLDSKNVELVGQLGGPAEAVARQGDHAYLVTGPWLVILDISDPDNPARVGAYEMSISYARDVAVAGTHVYIAADDGGLRILDISDPAEPFEVGDSPEVNQAMAVTVVGGYAYVCDSTDKVRIIDVSDPASPTLAGTYDPSFHDYIQDVTVTSDPGQVYAYVAYSNHLIIVDLTDPAIPTELGVYTTTARATAVALPYAYVAAGNDGLLVLDVSVPLTPTLVDTLDTPGSAHALAVSGTHAYVADGIGGLRVIDISSPGDLSEDSFCDTPDSAVDVVMAGSHALVADGERGLRIIDVSDPNDATQTSAYDVPSAAWSLAVSGTLAYVGEYYYDPGVARGALRIVDVGDPASPAQTGLAELADRGTGLALSGGYAFLSANEQGLLVVDVSDRFSPNEVAASDTPKLAFDVAVSGSYAYLAESQGLFVFDISLPLTPTLLAVWPTPGDPVSSVAVDANYVYAGVGRDNLHVIDVTNPVTPTETGVYTVSEYIYDLALMDDLLYMATDNAGLQIVDVSNPSSPAQAGLYDAWQSIQGIAVAGSPSGKTLAYILGEYEGQDGSQQNGLGVLDVSDPANPVELGLRSFLAEPKSVVAANGGSGGPYIYVADSSGGLAILRLRYHCFLPVVVRSGP